MNMNHNAKDQVLSLLQSYRATKRKIEQLRYEPTISSRAAARAPASWTVGC